MNIKEELKQLSTNDKSAEEVVKDLYHQYDILEKQQNELLKKAHLFNVIDIANKLEKACEQDLFPEKDTYFLDFYCIEKQNGGYKTYAKILSKNISHIEQDHFVVNLFTSMQNFNLDFATDEVTNKNFLELKPGIKEKILDLFLSDDLKNILRYNQMELYLPEHNTSNEKKLKV